MFESVVKSLSETYSVHKLLVEAGMLHDPECRKFIIQGENNSAAWIFSYSEMASLERAVQSIGFTIFNVSLPINVRKKAGAIQSKLISLSIESELNKE